MSETERDWLEGNDARTQHEREVEARHPTMNIDKALALAGNWLAFANAPKEQQIVMMEDFEIEIGPDALRVVANDVLTALRDTAGPEGGDES